PIRSKRDNDGKQHRHDVVMEAKTRLKESQAGTTDGPVESEIVQREGYLWLSARAEAHGFAVNEAEVRVDGYRQHRWHKPNHLIRFSTVEITGLLTVIDEDRLGETLSQGIGPAKGFGCGLLLVRRV
ncbi:MAG: type I-E CRISPR-associated protein Cas6/Cse3/CasE, partial [Candidatus Binatia bacterium]